MSLECFPGRFLDSADVAAPSCIMGLFSDIILLTGSRSVCLLRSEQTSSSDEESRSHQSRQFFNIAAGRQNNVQRCESVIDSVHNRLFIASLC